MRTKETGELLRQIPMMFFLAALCVGPPLVWELRRAAVEQLTQQEERSNAAIATLLGNLAGDELLGVLVLQGEEVTRQALLANEQRQELAMRMNGAVKGLPIAKIKLYSSAGITVYSSEDKQLGESKADNPGFQAAMVGQVGSLLVHRNHFNAFEGEVSNRDLVSSYVPVRQSSTGPVLGVLEVYSDVTIMLAEQRQTSLSSALKMAGALALLYAFLAFVLRRVIMSVRHSDTAKEERARKLSDLAMRDGLTNLHNRRAWDSFLESVRAGAPLSRRSAVLALDLDHFKPVNDQHGHAAGDAVLKEVALRLRGAVREADQIFRIGGDEFIVVMSGATPVLAELVARRVTEAVALPFMVGDQRIAIGVTAGVAVSTRAQPVDIDALVRAADAGLYKAKSARRGSYVIS